MQVAVKIFIKLMQNKKTRKIIITIIVGLIMLGLLWIIILLTAISSVGAQSGNSSALAQQARQEYDFWSDTTPQREGLSCQGERYCGHFNAPVVDWCAYFVGYCADTVELDLDDIGFSPSTTIWMNNLQSQNKLGLAGEYQPQIGNLIFFNYGGRACYQSTNSTDHIGIVVETSEQSITVIAGNEYNGATSNWANVSYVNMYTIDLDDDSIACYGIVGADRMVVEGELNTVVRDIICRNETGSLYAELNDEYGTVVANDNGALSIGVYGWHGNNALKILKQAYDNNTVQVNNIINSYGTSGNIIMLAIQNNADWSSYIPTPTSKDCIKAILLSSAGIAAQDDYALQDAQNYIDKCTQNGLSDNKCIAYCCDILNQYGLYSFDGGVLSGVQASDTLDDIYNSQISWSDRNYNYESRRTWTYNYVKNNL